MFVSLIDPPISRFLFRLHLKWLLTFPLLPLNTPHPFLLLHQPHFFPHSPFRSLLGAHMNPFCYNALPQIPLPLMNLLILHLPLIPYLNAQVCHLLLDRHPILTLSPVGCLTMVLHWNIWGFHSHRSALRHLISSLNPTIICLQETFLSPPSYPAPQPPTLALW